MKRFLSARQWLITLILLTMLSAATLLFYGGFHADAEFTAFAENFLLQEAQANPIHFHYTIDNADAYRVDEAALALPVYHAGDAANDSYALSLLSKQLAQFENRRLSENNRRLYELLCSYVDTLRRTAAYPYFAEPLSPASGAVAELPILLAEYRLDTADDVELYLRILEQIPAYFNGLIVYEREKALAGLFMSDDTTDEVIGQCDALMNREELESGDHFLQATFADRLEDLTAQGVLTEAESLSYQAENDRLLTTVVAPAYDRLADELTLLAGSGRDTCGLACYAGGREYYEALLRLQTGSPRDIADIKQLLYDDLSANYAALRQLIQDNETLPASLASAPALLPEMSPAEILRQLRENMAAVYPRIPADTDESPIGCTVKYVDNSLEAYSAPAFYMTPPIDDVSDNTIYINAADMSDDLSLFTTLAHEGWPGHLYQTVYCERYWAQSGITPLRSILYYGGFVEGWAMYAELSSYGYAAALAGDAHPEAAAYCAAYRLDRQIQLCLYSLLDIAIHYDGADRETVRRMLASIGQTDTETADAVYNYIAQEPCNYPKYYLGYLEIMELRRQAADVWRGNSQAAAAQSGDIDANPDFLYFFHRFLLENGPADFKTLSENLSAERRD